MRKKERKLRSLMRVAENMRLFGKHDQEKDAFIIKLISVIQRVMENERGGGGKAGRSEKRKKSQHAVDNELREVASARLKWMEDKHTSDSEGKKQNRRKLRSLSEISMRKKSKTENPKKGTETSTGKGLDDEVEPSFKENEKLEDIMEDDSSLTEEVETRTSQDSMKDDLWSTMLSRRTSPKHEKVMKRRKMFGSKDTINRRSSKNMNEPKYKSSTVTLYERSSRGAEVKEKERKETPETTVLMLYCKDEQNEEERNDRERKDEQNEEERNDRERRDAQIGTLLDFLEAVLREKLLEMQALGSLSLEDMDLTSVSSTSSSSTSSSLSDLLKHEKKTQHPQRAPEASKLEDSEPSKTTNEETSVTVGSKRSKGNENKGKSKEYICPSVEVDDLSEKNKENDPKVKERDETEKKKNERASLNLEIYSLTSEKDRKSQEDAIKEVRNAFKAPDANEDSSYRDSLDFKESDSLIRKKEKSYSSENAEDRKGEVKKSKKEEGEGSKENAVRKTEKNEESERRHSSFDSESESGKTLESEEKEDQLRSSMDTYSNQEFVEPSSKTSRLKRRTSPQEEKKNKPCQCLNDGQEYSLRDKRSKALNNVGDGVSRDTPVKRSESCGCTPDGRRREEGDENRETEKNEESERRNSSFDSESKSGKTLESEDQLRSSMDTNGNQEFVEPTSKTSRLKGEACFCDRPQEEKKNPYKPCLCRNDSQEYSLRDKRSKALNNVGDGVSRDTPVRSNGSCECTPKGRRREEDDENRETEKNEESERRNSSFDSESESDKTLQSEERDQLRSSMDTNSNQEFVEPSSKTSRDLKREVCFCDRPQEEKNPYKPCQCWNDDQESSLRVKRSKALNNVGDGVSRDTPVRSSESCGCTPKGRRREEDLWNLVKETNCQCEDCCTADSHPVCDGVDSNESFCNVIFFVPC